MKKLAEGKPGHCDAGRDRRDWEGRRARSRAHLNPESIALTPTEKETETKRQIHKPRAMQSKGVGGGKPLPQSPLGSILSGQAEASFPIHSTASKTPWAPSQIV